MGASQTILVFSGGSTCEGGNTTCLVSFEDSVGEYFGNGTQTGVQWTGGYSQGATSITVANSLNITANSTVVVLDQCDTGYSGNSSGSGSGYSTCGSGSAKDNGNYFNCSDAYNPSGSTGCDVNAPDGGAARTHRFQEEWAQVSSCSPSCNYSGTTTLTLSRPLMRPNWSSGQSPEMFLIQANNYVGMQGFAVQAAGTSAGAAVSFNNIANCWVKGVAVLNPYSQGINLDGTDQCDVESDYVYNAGQNNTASDPSGIDYYGSNNLIANNILQAQRLSTIGNGPVSGNVVAYNFAINCFDGISSGGGDYMFACLWDGHSNGADYNLIEGNVANQVNQDPIHGTHLMETFYRNFFTGWESCANGNCGPGNTQKDVNLQAVNNLAYHRYGNWVANVLGTPNGPSSSGYRRSDPSGGNGLPGTAGYIYDAGSGDSCSSSSGCVGGPVPVDSLVAATSLFWGNWDAYNATTRWVTSEVPSGVSVYPNSVPSSSCTSSLSCPASFYYSSRPSWWSSSIPFPAIGPDVTGGNVGQCTGALNIPGEYGGLPAISASQCKGTSLAVGWAGHVNAIPALSCYLNVMEGPPDGTGSALTFDANTCYGGTSAAPAAPTGLQANVQ
jgi:hypothetical protein